METFIQIVLPLLNVVVLFLLVFWKGFFSQRGKNKADILDKATLTSIEETVRRSFNQEFAQYELVNQHKFSIATEERNAIFAYNDALHEFIFLSFNSIYVEKYTTNPNGIEDLRTDNNSIQLKYTVHRERLKLFFSDPEFTALEQTVQTDVLSMQALNVAYHVQAKKYVGAHTPEDLKKSVEVFDYGQMSVLEIRMGLAPHLIKLSTMLNQYIQRVYNQPASP
ncbi:MAG: hypothetical protein JNJ75_03615 [Cyclobacteriaceae bacterium]|nr:hypothetical protein [Cyclobacteriaceae bacterium]